MEALLAALVMAVLAAFTAWLSCVARRSDALDRLIDIVSVAGQLAPFSGRETMGGWPVNRPDADRHPSPEALR